MRIAGLIWMLRRAAPVLVVLALAMRIVVPAGVMFAETPGGGLQMTLCTGQGGFPVRLRGDGGLHTDRVRSSAGSGALAGAHRTPWRQDGTPAPRPGASGAASPQDRSPLPRLTLSPRPASPGPA